MHQYCWGKINKAAESTHFACPSRPTSDSGKPGYPAPGHFKRHNGPFQLWKLAFRLWPWFVHYSLDRSLPLLTSYSLLCLKSCWKRPFPPGEPLLNFSNYCISQILQPVCAIWPVLQHFFAYRQSSGLLKCTNDVIKKKRVTFLVASGKESACQCRRLKLNPWSRKIPHATEKLSLCPTTTESGLYSPGATTITEPVSHNDWSPRAQSPWPATRMSRNETRQ